MQVAITLASGKDVEQCRTLIHVGMQTVDHNLDGPVCRRSSTTASGSRRTPSSRCGSGGRTQGSQQATAAQLEMGPRPPQSARQKRSDRHSRRARQGKRCSLRCAEGLSRSQRRCQLARADEQTCPVASTQAHGMLLLRPHCSNRRTRHRSGGGRCCRPTQGQTRGWAGMERTAGLSMAARPSAGTRMRIWRSWTGSLARCGIVWHICVLLPGLSRTQSTATKKFVRHVLTLTLQHHVPGYAIRWTLL